MELPMLITKSITVARPRSEVYAFWRDFENLPRFMHHVESVQNLGGGRSHWVAKGIAGTDREWDAELVDDKPNERVSWRTIGDDNTARHTGTVSFLSIGDSATEVRVDIEYDPPAGALGASLARLFGEEPSQQIEEDLERFKRVLETGDTERRSQRTEGVADISVPHQEPVEPKNREVDPGLRF
jgi:uncharacterized membrane protein